MDFSRKLTPGDDREVRFEGGPLIVAKLLLASPLKGRGPRNHIGTGQPRDHLFHCANRQNGALN